MDFTQILSYQNLDRELYNIERQIKSNENKRKAEEMHESMRAAQEKSLQLEKKAGVLLADIEKMKKQFQIQQDKINEFMSKDLSKMSSAEIAKLTTLKDKLSQNLVILDKNLTALAENINAVLAEFNKTIKTFNSAKAQYNASKTAYEKDVESVESKKDELAKKLAVLAKTVDSKLMDAYQKRRHENIFPVIVPLRNNSCGGCHIELPYANISKLESEGILSCEHCRRIIYKD